MSKAQVLSGKIKTICIYGIWLYFIYLMILITIQYIPIQFDVAFLRIKEEAIQHTYYKIAFFTHVYTSIFVLISGLTQFSAYLRKHYSYIHRIIGKIYILLIIFFAAPSGFVMGMLANGGFIAQLSFCLLAALWFYFTLRAFLEIKKGNYLQHKNFMIRSYALTLSAISLRLFKFIITNTLHTPPMDTYIVVAWLGWTANLALAEFIIYRNRK